MMVMMMMIDKVRLVLCFPKTISKVRRSKLESYHLQFVYLCQILTLRGNANFKKRYFLFYLHRYF